MHLSYDEKNSFTTTKPKKVLPLHLVFSIVIWFRVGSL